MSQSLLSGGDQQDVEVPLMAMNNNNDVDDGSDGVEDLTVHNNGIKKKSRFRLWTPFSGGKRYRIVPTGGKREWKETRIEGKRNGRRALAIILCSILLLALIVLVIFLIYSMGLRNYVYAPPPKYPWTTSFCVTGMKRLVDLCPCLLEVDITSTATIFRQKFDLATCIDMCVNDPDAFGDDDDGTAAGDDDAGFEDEDKSDS